MKDAKVITGIMDFGARYYVELIEEMQKEHGDEMLRMITETCVMIEEHKEYMDKKKAEWEIERKALRKKIRQLKRQIIRLEDIGSD